MRNCLLQHNLEEDFEIQGIVKPGSDLAAITNTVTRDTGIVTKHDVAVWGDAKDVSKNETLKGFCEIRIFVENHSQTNILVLNVPNRYNLDAHFCVN